jgi:hypothetical protein
MTFIADVDELIELEQIADSAAETIVERALLRSDGTSSTLISLSAESFLIWLDATMDTNYCLPGEIEDVLIHVRNALNYRLQHEQWMRWNDEPPLDVNPDLTGMEPMIGGKGGTS